MGWAAVTVTVLSVCAARAGAQCTGYITAARIAEFDQLIAANPVCVFDYPNTNCLIKGQDALAAKGVCHHYEPLTQSEWSYFQCKQNELVNGRQMHSYFYLGGEAGYAGNGFKLVPGLYSASMTEMQVQQKIDSSGAATTCNGRLSPPWAHPDLDTCTSQLAGSMLTLDVVNDLIRENKVMLFGWTQCPCTGYALRGGAVITLRPTLLNIGNSYGRQSMIECRE
jgi:hypothetical protein